MLSPLSSKATSVPIRWSGLSVVGSCFRAIAAGVDPLWEAPETTSSCRVYPVIVDGGIGRPLNGSRIFSCWIGGAPIGVAPEIPSYTPRSVISKPWRDRLLDAERLGLDLNPAVVLGVGLMTDPDRVISAPPRHDDQLHAYSQRQAPRSNCQPLSAQSNLGFAVAVVLDVTPTATLKLLVRPKYSVIRWPINWAD